jgi:hypothetical protein
MRNNNFLDNLLTKIDKENIIKMHFEDGDTSEQISKQLFMSRRFIEDVIFEHQFNMDRQLEFQHND